MTNLSIGIISAFSGVLSAFILALVKEWCTNWKRQKSTLIQVKYIIKKYQNQIQEINSWFQQNRRDINDIIIINKDINLQKSINPELKDSLEQYGQFFTDELELISGLKLPVEDLNFLTIKNEKVLDAILLSRSQYIKVIYIIKQRNIALEKLTTQIAAVNSLEEFTHVMNINENFINSSTKELTKTITQAESDFKKAITYLDSN